KFLVTATQAGGVRLVEAASGKDACQFVKAVDVSKADTIAALEMALRPGRLRLALAPDGEALAVGSQGGLLILYEVRSCKTLRQWKAAAEVIGVVFAPDNKSLVTKAQDQVLCQWNLEGKEIRKFTATQKSYGFGVALAFSPDGAVIATQSGEIINQQPASLVKRWDVKSGKELLDVKGADAGQEQALLAPDLKTLAWRWRRDMTVRLWDVEKDKELRKLEGAASAFGFSPDARTLVGRADDRFVCLWTAETGKLLHKLASTAGVADSIVSP